MLLAAAGLVLLVAVAGSSRAMDAAQPIIGVVTDPIAHNSTAGAGWVGVSMSKWLEVAEGGFFVLACGRLSFIFGDLCITFYTPEIWHALE
jgi:hypothetical protein